MRSDLRVCSALLVLFLILLVSGCATIYTAPDFGSYRYAHSKIALLTFDVTFEIGDENEIETARELQQLEAEQGESFQRAVYTLFLQGQQRGRYTVEFQDIEKTNTLLNRELEQQTSSQELTALTKAEICTILDVDAVISGDITLDRPMGPDTAIASRLFSGLIGTTNQAHIRMSIHEGEESKLLWNYEHVARGGLLSSPESVARAVMKGATRTFPYSNNR